MAFSDSANFILDTVGLPPGSIGGVAWSDSTNFVADTVGLPSGGIGGVSWADSTNFIVDTTGLPPDGIGGVTWGDSAGLFVVDTVGLPPGGIGGVAYADSGNFTLDTTGFPPGVGWSGWFTWNNPLGGNWNVATNWTPNTVPGAQNAAYITLPGTYTVTVSSSTVVNTLVLGATSGADSQTLNIANANLTISNSSSGTASGIVSFNGSSVNTLAALGGLTLAGPLYWSGGAITGAVQFNGGAFSSASLKLNGGLLINSGVLTWSNSTQLADGQGSVFTNLAGGVINVYETNTTWINGGSLGGTHIFGNSGTINLNGSSSQTIFSENLVSSGLININSGTLFLDAGTAQISGAVTVASGATLNLDGSPDTLTVSPSGAGNLIVVGGTAANLNNGLGLTGSWSFQGGTTTVTGPSSTGPGTTISVSGSATVNFNGTGTLAPPTLIVSGGTLSGSQSLSAGTLNWSGGTIEAGVQFNGGTFSTTSLSLNGGRLTNSGALTCANGADAIDGNGSVFTNLSTGVINVYATNSAWINGGSLGGAHIFGNSGTINLNGSNSQTIYAENLVSSGPINVNSGTLFLDEGTAQISGPLTVASGATLNLGGSPDTLTVSPSGAGNLIVSGGTAANLNNGLGLTGSWTFQGGTTTITGPDSTGPGTTISVSGSGTVNFNGSGTVTPPTLAVSGGTLGGSQNLTAGTLNWSGGTIAAGVQFNGGTFSPASLSLNGGRLTNSGALTWANGANLVDGNGSVFTNLAGGIINVYATNSQWMNGGSLGGTHVVGNNGTINLDGSLDEQIYQESFVNSGIVMVNSGTDILAIILSPKWLQIA